MGGMLLGRRWHSVVGIRIATAITSVVTVLAGTIPAAPTRQAEEREIYAAVLASIFRGNVPSALVVQTMPLVMRPPVASDWSFLGPSAASLPAAVAAAGASSTAAQFTADLFPPGTVLVSREEIAEWFRTAPPGRTPEDRWLPFRSRFKVRTYQGFSRSVLTADRLVALVWYSHACGMLCGEAGYALLQRSNLGVPWAVVKHLPRVMS